jgi:hypothetical protein
MQKRQLYWLLTAISQQLASCCGLLQSLSPVLLTLLLLLLLLLLLQAYVPGHHVGHRVYSRITATAGAAVAHTVGTTSHRCSGVLAAGSVWGVITQWQG